MLRGTAHLEGCRASRTLCPNHGHCSQRWSQGQQSTASSGTCVSGAENLHPCTLLYGVVTNCVASLVCARDFSAPPSQAARPVQWLPNPRLCATRSKVTAWVALVLVSPFAGFVASVPRRMDGVGYPEPCAASNFGRVRLWRESFPLSSLFSTSFFACPLIVSMHAAPGFLAPSLPLSFCCTTVHRDVVNLAPSCGINFLPLVASPLLWRCCFRHPDVNAFQDFLLTMRMFLCTGWRTIGGVTSYSALVTIRTLRNTSRSFGSPNSVRPFLPPLFVCLFSKMHISLEFRIWLLRIAHGFSSRRATCVAQACRRYISLPTRGACHLHATSPTCGDVLQVGAARRLQQSGRSHVAVRLRGRARVA